METGIGLHQRRQRHHLIARRQIRQGIDTGPDFTGEVVLDNIDMNAVLDGRTKCLPSGCPF
jgi:hypothetical protein